MVVFCEVDFFFECFLEEECFCVDELINFFEFIEFVKDFSMEDFFVYLEIDVGN